MVVVPIDNRHLRLGMPEGLRGGHAPKAAPDDRHPRDVMSPVTHLETIMPCRRGASLPWSTIGWNPLGQQICASQDFAVQCLLDTLGTDDAGRAAVVDMRIDDEPILAH